ncbi:type VI secretion system contractile sheath large subunit [Fangia hongkongensis]|uniref:type VI secretion system contractile sheath large subunit n=1 Tax=Fangia hongkongensis TaxID=270495 RepID=UPI0003783D49|nr:type VI secretion system contractile sheath large subunit [Fangia hongkongensis]MBK2125036.1 type VI secretion system contractile sheath large subunit [Fangia hongkongensis]
MSETTTASSTALNDIFTLFGGSENEHKNSLAKVDVDISDNMQAISNISDDYYARNIAALALVLANNDEIVNYNKVYVQRAIERINEIIEAQVNSIISHPDMRYLENQWLQLNELMKHDYDNIDVAILDVSKEELQYDFERNLYDISSSELFKKVYVAEYDQYGGEPFGLMLGLYDFKNTMDDITWLTGMGMVAESAHAPFISSVNPSFFGVNDIGELKQIKSFETLLEHPRYRDWNAFRQTDQAAYIGLTLGDFILRQPYHPVNAPVADSRMNNFVEEVNDYETNGAYQWGSASILFAKNAMRSYGKTGWFQYIRGPENGGYVKDLIAPVYNIRGFDEQRSALNISLPDYMELSLANIGIMPVIEEKGTPNCCFFSVNSIKKVEEFVDNFDSMNSQLVANMSYTLCISRISHYIKCVIRDKIGSITSTEIIQQQLSDWLSRYVTTVYQPTAIEMAKYPFRAAEIKVTNIPGKAGWYKCSITVLPHIQFEGMDTTLKIDTRLDPGLFAAEEGGE